MSTPTSTALPDRRPIEIVLPIEGMTCASCVNRIERFLTRTPGVEHAAVNLATEQATVRVDPGIAGRAELVRAVEAAGYDVRPDRHDRDAASSMAVAAELTADDVERERAQRTTLIQAVAAIATALGIMLAMYVPQTALASRRSTGSRCGRRPWSSSGRADASTARPGGQRATAPPTWTRWLRSGPARRGSTAWS